tara:strand:+ start:203 stop:502 length:300 start_codon:yes stop_codon:yes gene_type:complete
MNTLLYFRGGTEDAAILRLEDCAIFAENDAVVFATGGANKQTVSIAIADGASASVLKLLANKLAELRGLSKVIVVRDTVDAVLLVAGLGAVTCAAVDIT